MTIDEAIAHANEIAGRCALTDDDNDRKCWAEHRQLAEWLRELKERRMKMSDVIDPMELVKELADKIGIDQLYALTVELRGEGTRMVELEKQNAELTSRNECLRSQIYRLEGKVEGLTFALRCDGISGAEVK